MGAVAVTCWIKVRYPVPAQHQLWLTDYTGYNDTMHNLSWIHTSMMLAQTSTMQHLRPRCFKNRPSRQFDVAAKVYKQER